MGIVVLVSRQVIRLLSAADRISSAYRMWAMMNKVDNMHNPGNSKDHLLRSGLKIVLASIIASSQLTVVYSAQGEKTDRDEAGLRGLVKTVATRDVRPIVTIEQFDPSGKLTETTVKDARSGAVQLKFVTDLYDSKGRRLRETTYTSSGVVRSRIKYLYDASGRHMGQIWLDKDGTLEDARFVRFDSSGRFQEEIAVVDVLNGTMRRHTYTYDASGNRIIEVTQTGSDSQETTNSYNDKQLLVEQVVRTSDGKVLVKRVFTHDSEGNVTNRENYDGEAALLNYKESYIYEYDSHRNWTKMTTNFLLRNGQPSSKVMVTERTIDYFQKDGR